MNALDLSVAAARKDLLIPARKSALLSKRRRGELEEEIVGRVLDRRVGEIALPSIVATSAASSESPAPAALAGLSATQAAATAGASKAMILGTQAADVAAAAQSAAPAAASALSATQSTGSTQSTAPMMDAAVPAASAAAAALSPATMTMAALPAATAAAVVESFAPMAMVNASSAQSAALAGPLQEIPVGRRALPPLPQLTYEQFSAMTPEQAKIIMDSSGRYIVLDSQAKTMWHNWGKKGSRCEIAAFHFTIEHTVEAMERAFPIIFSELIKDENALFKILPKRSILESNYQNYYRNCYGKEFVVFELDRALYDGSARERAQEGGVMMRIVKKLNDAHIPKGRSSLGSSPVKGGMGYLYFRTIRNFFGMYANPADLAAWDFTRRESLFLFPGRIFPPIENSTFEVDPWVSENSKEDWSHPTFYVDFCLWKMLQGYRNERIGLATAKLFEKFLENGMTLNVYVASAMALRTKALEKLQLKEKEYPPSCLVPAVYYHFLKPLHYEFFFKGIEEVDPIQPFKSRPDLEKRLILKMASSSFREKGVQYLFDFPRYIGPIRERFRDEKAWIEWLNSLI